MMISLLSSRRHVTCTADPSESKQEEKKKSTANQMNENVYKLRIVILSDEIVLMYIHLDVDILGPCTHQHHQHRDPTNTYHVNCTRPACGEHK